MKLGDMEFWRDEDGDWIEDPILYVDTLLDYIESHGLDKADEEITELIHENATLQRLANERADKIAELSRLLDTERAFNESLLSETSYKQRFIDETARGLFTQYAEMPASDAWEAAKDLWKARITD